MGVEAADLEHGAAADRPTDLDYGRYVRLAADYRDRGYRDAGGDHAFAVEDPSLNALLIVVLAPLLGAVLAGLFGRVIGRAGAHSATIAGVAVSFLVSAQVLYQLVTGKVGPFNQDVYTFFEVGRYSAHVGFLVDNLTAMMMVVVSFVSLLVHVYTIGYMKDDPGSHGWTTAASPCPPRSRSVAR